MDERLARLLNLDGPSGFEAGVAGFLKEEFGRLSDSTRVDGLGNVVAEKRGSGRGSLLIAAHMDEVGFMVQYVYPNGFIKFVPLGGWDDRILPGMEVKLLGEKEVFGVVSTKPPHITSESERNQVIKMEEMFMDTGLDAKSLAELGVTVGTPVVPVSAIRQSGSTVSSKALDDRAGCYNLLRVLEAVDKPKSTLYFVGTVQEEVGLRGARVLANSIRVDAALILESTVAADQPGLPDEKRPATMNGGAVLTVMDRSMIADRVLYGKLKKLADTLGVLYQIKKPSYGGTDAGEIHLGQGGIPSAVVSVPCRYIHSAHSYMSLKDIEEVSKLVGAFAAQFESKTVTHD